ncbi:MAG: cupin domain-containing protein [Candidatus Odinarchaeota archaeon]
MLIKDISSCQEVTAPDGAAIRELLHPDREIGELKMDYSLAYAVVKIGKSTYPHRLKSSSEVYYILNGRGMMHIEDESSIVTPGQVVYVPPNKQQYIENKGQNDLEYLVIVYPSWNPSDPELLQSRL